MMATCSRASEEVEGESTTVGPNWLELPRDVTANILQRLDIVEIVTSACQVCPLWWNICKDPLMWCTIDMSNLCYSYSSNDLRNICRNAVDRSCGHLENIDIEYFGTDDLLKYIVDRSSHLRSMRIALCWTITDKGLNEVAKKLALLEELDISFTKLSDDSLQVIGKCCPLLKSLKLNRSFVYLNEERAECDDEAFVIAETMPKLRHLEIRGNLMTNDGLLAILDGCPLLQSLDLEECLRLDLWMRSLEKRCRDQIKDLRLPVNYFVNFKLVNPPENSVEFVCS